MARLVRLRWCRERVRTRSTIMLQEAIPGRRGDSVFRSVVADARPEGGEETFEGNLAMEVGEQVGTSTLVRREVRAWSTTVPRDAIGQRGDRSVGADASPGGGVEHSRGELAAQVDGQVGTPTLVTGNGAEVVDHGAARRDRATGRSERRRRCLTGRLERRAQTATSQWVLMVRLRRLRWRRVWVRRRSTTTQHDAIGAIGASTGA